MNYKKDKISILLCGDISYDSRVKRFSKLISSKFSNVKIHSLKRRDNANQENISKINLSLKEHTLISDHILPRGGKWGYIKYLEFFIRFIFASISSNVIYCNDIETLPVGFFLKTIFRNKKIIYDTHELAPYKGSPSRKKIRIRAFVESILIKKADSVITVSKRIAVWYRRVYRLQKVTPLYNSPEVEKFIPEDKIKFSNKNNTIKFVWHGILSNNRGIDKVIDVIHGAIDVATK